MFGEGTYLSSELSVSLLYSQSGEAWSKSCLGAKLACVAVCEMIDGPSVKCQVKEGEYYIYYDCLLPEFLQTSSTGFCLCNPIKLVLFCSKHQITLQFPFLVCSGFP